MGANYYVILKSQDIEGVPHVGLWTNDSEFEDLHGITIGTYPENSREYNDLKRYMSDFTHQIVGYLNDTKGTIVQISREIYPSITYLEALYTKE